MSQLKSNQAYQTSSWLGANPRQTEARALLEAARRLSEVPVDGENMEEYRASLRLNWRLWTIIQSDIASEENPLPSEIKANIMSLSIFIDKHTVGALAEPDTRKLGVLIDINRNIASGLMTTPDAEQAPMTPSGGTPPSNENIVA
jgi:flagellar protein FlaF